MENYYDSKISFGKTYLNIFFTASSGELYSLLNKWKIKIFQMLVIKEIPAQSLD